MLFFHWSGWKLFKWEGFFVVEYAFFIAQTKKKKAEPLLSKLLSKQLWEQLLFYLPWTQVLAIRKDYCFDDDFD